MTVDRAADGIAQLLLSVPLEQRLDVLTLAFSEYVKRVEQQRAWEEMAFSSEVAEKFLRSIDTLDLPVRVANCLCDLNISLVGELAMCPDHELLGIKNFGRKSLKEVRAALAKIGLKTGMILPLGLVNRFKTARVPHPDDDAAAGGLWSRDAEQEDLSDLTEGEVEGES